MYVLKVLRRERTTYTPFTEFRFAVVLHSRPLRVVCGCASPGIRRNRGRSVHPSNYFLDKLARTAQRVTHVSSLLVSQFNLFLRRVSLENYGRAIAMPA